MRNAVLAVICGVAAWGQVSAVGNLVVDQVDGNGFCAVVGNPGGVTRCPDVRVRRVGANAAARQVGGNGFEGFRGLVVMGDGAPVVAMDSFSGDFAGSYRADQGNGAVVVRLDVGLARVEATRRFELNGSVSAMAVDGERVLVGGVIFVDAGRSRYFVAELRGDDLSVARQWEFEGGSGSHLFAVAPGAEGTIVAAWGRVVEGPKLVRFRRADGAVVFERALEMTAVRSVAPLPGGGVAVFGNRPGEGVVQRWSVAGEAVEAPQVYGREIVEGRADAAGKLVWTGMAKPGLETSADATFACRLGRSGYYLAEMPYQEGRATFVSYLGWPLGAVALGGTTYRMGEEIYPDTTVPREGAEICIEAGAVSYGVARGLASEQPAWVGEVAPGEMVTLYGAKLAQGTAMVDPAVARELPREIGGTRVIVDDVPVGLIEVAPGRVSAVMPFGIAGREVVRVRVERDGARTADNLLRVAPTRPVVVGVVREERVASAFLLGAGEMTGGNVADRVVENPGLIVAAVKVVVEGVGEVPVLWAGTAPGQLPGLAQVNFRLPAEALERLPLAISVTVGGRTATAVLR